MASIETNKTYNLIQSIEDRTAVIDATTIFRGRLGEGMNAGYHHTAEAAMCVELTATTRAIRAGEEEARIGDQILLDGELITLDGETDINWDEALLLRRGAAA